MSQIRCPFCGDENTVYAMFSGGREMFCPTCDDNFAMPELPRDQMPRAALLRTPEGRVALRAQMDQELARRYDPTIPAATEEA